MKDISVSTRRLENILNEFKNNSIAVIGDIMLDKYMWGEVRRISPEAPVPVVEIESTSTRLGGAANVVQNLNSLGINPVLISLLGDDEAGSEIKQMISESGCCSDSLICSKFRPTTTKTRIMAKHQQIVRADQEITTDLNDEEYSDLSSCFNKKIDTVKGVIISDYGKGVTSPALIKEIILQCRKNNKFLAVDPKERHFNLYNGASLITPNLKEAHAMLGIAMKTTCSDEEIRELGWKILDQLSLEHLLVTMSERGMALFEAQSRSFTHLPTVARNVFDVTGAGDTVISVFSAAYVSGATPLEAALLANHAAGLTVAELGTASVDIDTLLADCLSAIKK
ncbi:D-glycero-beta-D-manno-heptose-7-phosphate kinase [Chitinispirillales bacterium ANBcel5]|uniref:D-glycero-beta-D-manno-heptose-7-phosphate kinase n=1 Tax=Cellulosispirillum alkaliphilum TaxID=3039283 RepID=UPI002A53BB9D|nr:D-glycero-beta-D-manno-heptose-7-phosphate kinase [Chitinispirillales bacterium ANBcel5]